MYVLTAGTQGVVASFSVDNGQETTVSVPAPPGPLFQMSNVSMFDIQSLESGPHTVVMTVLSWTMASPSFMMFDYARVNETSMEPASIMSDSVSSTSSAPSPTDSPGPDSRTPTSNKVNASAVAGGTIAGVLGAAVIVLGIIFVHKRKSALTRAEEGLNVPIFTIDTFVTDSPPAPHISATGSFLPRQRAESSASEFSRKAAILSTPTLEIPPAGAIPASYMSEPSTSASCSAGPSASRHMRKDSLQQPDTPTSDPPPSSHISSSAMSGTTLRASRPYLPPISTVFSNRGSSFFRPPPLPSPSWSNIYNPHSPHNSTAEPPPLAEITDRLHSRTSLPSTIIRSSGGTYAANMSIDNGSRSNLVQIGPQGIVMSPVLPSYPAF
ncbi:hypothetical protein HYDPIDRAFT_29560 [Hydnomerulius pinastri MD-312]|uniref:Uncharacterized protein n=1 Tax=Hydnomerulius pinastri MD-312 TaxID=994086 RepID=A0A0C9WEG3_9AGAM|nr:hypothetical protein HYDPIDRAFT_29560 [Hydnomerulius pinastri MD-312]